MYILSTEFYSNKHCVVTEFDEFKDALFAAEHMANFLNGIMTLTRHSSCGCSINHCGYYADHYNELFICVKRKV